MDSYQAQTAHGDLRPNFLPNASSVALREAIAVHRRRPRPGPMIIPPSNEGLTQGERGPYYPKHVSDVRPLLHGAHTLCAAPQ
jgi:hypothetical protein